MQTGHSIQAQLAHGWWLRDGQAVRLQQHVDTLRVARAMAPE